MGREDIGSHDGMAFAFGEPTARAFWMKDTLIPLSIAFWDEDGRIMAILDMQPCEADPARCTTRGWPTSGAIEVNLGFFEEHGIERGDRIGSSNRAADRGCLLCPAERVTPWHFEDEACWVADCLVCRTPMIVWRSHGLPDSDLERGAARPPRGHRRDRYP